MTYTLRSLVFQWFLLSLGLWKMSEKMHWEKRWMAWVPGLRMAALGKSMDADADGLWCGVLEAAGVVWTLLPLNIRTEDVRAAAVLLAVLFVFALARIIYSLRLFSRVGRLFRLRRGWILIWLFLDWLGVLILGFGSRQPVEEFSFKEDWQAGTAPAQITGVQTAVSGGRIRESGLSIRLRERTVRQFGKKLYLLKDIHLDIPNGSMVLLLGGSGAGKTTLVNAVIGYEKADADIWLNGSDVYSDYGRMKYRIGFVPQQNLMRGNDTVLRTVSDAAKLRMPVSASREQRKARVGEVMDLLGLSDGGEGLVSKKSGGMQRRISIALELVSDPELFVLDEPDSGLDGVIARELFQRLRTIADSGRIVIVITHTPDRVIDLFDRVIVLARDSGRVGRLAFYGSPDEARTFFGKNTMEEIVMSVNRKEDGGEGLADEYIGRFARTYLQSSPEREQEKESENLADQSGGPENGPAAAPKAPPAGEPESPLTEGQDPVKPKGGASL